VELREEDIKRAVEDLFQNGAGEKAVRLVLMSHDGRILGGWSKEPLINQLCRSLGIAKKLTK